MRTPCIRHVPDRVAARLANLAAPIGLPLSTFALQELTQTNRPPGRHCDVAGPLTALPMDRATILESLRDSSAHDALYVALAERLDVPLLTADSGIARSPG